MNSGLLRSLSEIWGFYPGFGGSTKTVNRMSEIGRFQLLTIHLSFYPLK